MYFYYNNCGIWAEENYKIYNNGIWKSLQRRAVSYHPTVIRCQTPSVNLSSYLEYSDTDFCPLDAQFHRSKTTCICILLV